MTRLPEAEYEQPEADPVPRCLPLIVVAAGLGLFLLAVAMGTKVAGIW